MSLSVGIVGFPNTGKSTLFNALLGRQIASTAAYPFCTIEPNVGVVELPDKRLTALAKVVQPRKVTPATVKFIDIAGLVKGAHKGEGLGNKFLSHIREAGLICFVLRGFENIADRAGSLDPESDLSNLKSELLLKDLETIEKHRPRVKDIKEKRKIEMIGKKLIDGINNGEMVKDIIQNEEEAGFIKSLNLLTSKPYFIVLNIGENDLSKIEKIINNYKDWTVVPICAKLEEELASLSSWEQKKYLQTVGLRQSGLERLIKTAYDFLELISFLTAGQKEVRAWTIKKGTKAPQAGKVIHADFEKNFIKVKVINYQDFINLGGWVKAAEKGRVGIEGKDYEIQDGDVVEFMINK